MFEGIVLHKQPETGAALDAGLLAEALLFFQNVTVLLDFGNTISLIKSIGPDIFFNLIEEGLIKVTYSQNDMGTQTDTVNGIPQHRQIFYSFVGSSLPKAGNRKRQHIEGVLEKSGIPRFRMREFYKRFNDSVKLSNKSDMIPKDDVPSTFIGKDKNSQIFYNNAAKEVLDFHAPQYLNDKALSFRAIGDDEKFYILDNLNYDDLNKYVSAYSGDERTVLTPAYIAQCISSAKLDLLIGAHYGFDISTGEISRRVNELKLNNLYQKINKNLELPSLFQEKIINNVGNIRTAINSGKRTFEEFLPLFNKSDKFKSWLKGLHPDDDLIEEYYVEVSRQGWGDRLPAKSIRFGLFTGAGLLIEAIAPSGISTAIGAGIGATDTFLLDKVIKGWRPSTFVSDVKNFLPEE